MLGILLFSSALLHWGERAVDRGHDATARLAIVQTIGLGLAFLIIQLSTFRHATIFLIIGAHGANVLLGLLMLSYTLILPRIGADVRTARHPMRTAARYWHCIGVGWIAIVALLFLLPRL